MVYEETFVFMPLLYIHWTSLITSLQQDAAIVNLEYFKHCFICFTYSRWGGISACNSVKNYFLIKAVQDGM